MAMAGDYDMPSVDNDAAKDPLVRIWLERRRAEEAARKRLDAALRGSSAAYKTLLDEWAARRKER